MTEKQTFEEVIARQGKLVYTNVGDSMYPLIQPHDLLVIEAVKKPLRQFDIPLYKRDNGRYVLHRIMRIENGEYLMCGDNRYGYNSRDSRSFGPIPTYYVKAKLAFVVGMCRIGNDGDCSFDMSTLKWPWQLERL